MSSIERFRTVNYFELTTTHDVVEEMMSVIPGELRQDIEVEIINLALQRLGARKQQIINELVAQERRKDQRPEDPFSDNSSDILESGL